MITLILLKKGQYKKILSHSLKALPNEACGLLGGRIEGETEIVERVYLMVNIDNSPEHFSMDPKEQFSAVRDMRNNGWVMLGNFHSHPETPSRPSDEDKRLAFDPEASYMILSLMDRESPILKSFRIKGNEAQEETVKIIEGE